MKIHKLFLPLLFASQLVAGGYAQLTPDENDQYENELSNALAYEKAKIIAFEEREPITSSEKLELLKMKTNYEFKFNLAKKYIRTHPLRSKDVRDKLVSLIKKEKVGPADLLKFQTFVDKEKEKIRAYDEAVVYERE